MLATSGGFRNVDEVLDLTLSQIEVWVDAEYRKRRDLRLVMVLDTTASIGGAFSKKGIDPYLSAIRQDKNHG